MLRQFSVLSILFGVSLAMQSNSATAEDAIFAGGCFWCVEYDLEKLNGVREVTSGYAGGTRDEPTYKTYERSGHREVVNVDFDETVISYEQLLEIFLRTVDVTDAGGQFCDRGFGYSTAIYPSNAAQKQAAERVLAKAEESLGQKIVTPIEPSARFWAAEDYHQNYYKSSKRQLTRFGYITRAKAYKNYRNACGRDITVKRVWGDQAYKGIPNS